MMNTLSPETNNAIHLAAQTLRKAHRVVVFSGAGVSAESGIPTFRASDGLWEGHRVEDVASPQGFARDPQLVWNFYNARRANVATVQPNAGHQALVSLEEHFKNRFTITTQNVDGLHQQAGSKSVLELHGSLQRTRCTTCGEIRDQALIPLPELPKCESCQQLLRPDIVWFGEALPVDVWTEAQRSVMRCDVLLVVGTSAVVYPAAGLIALAKGRSTYDFIRPAATVIEANLTPTEASNLADIGIYGPSGQTLPQLLKAFELLPSP
jgi:NAD-dependent deacetylase